MVFIFLRLVHEDTNHSDEDIFVTSDPFTIETFTIRPFPTDEQKFFPDVQSEPKTEVPAYIPVYFSGDYFDHSADNKTVERPLDIIQILSNSRGNAYHEAVRKFLHGERLTY